MNYSCKSDSIWETFWSNDSDDIFKSNQVFEIEDIDPIKFTFEELKESIDDCLSRVMLHFALEKEEIVYANYYVNRLGSLCYTEKTIRRKPTKLSKSHLSELRNYMEKFIFDVENDTSLI